jgi:acid phosphatase
MTSTPITRRELLEAGVAAAVAPAVLATPALARAQPSLNFLAVGDWGRDGLFNQSQVAQRMGEEAAKSGAAFVLSAGDNFYPDGVRSVTDPQWKTSFENVYSAPSLQIPWYSALGNHDYHSDPEAEIAYGRTSPRWRMPARHYSFSQTAPDGAELDVFVLDTSPMILRYTEEGDAKMHVAGQDVGAQLAWFDSALARSTAQWKVVVAHHPVYSGGEHGDTPELIAQVLPLLKRSGVQLFINGHDHDLQLIERDGLAFVGCGAGSRTRPTTKVEGTKFCSDQSGFTAYRLDRGGLRIAFIDFEGRTLHESRLSASMKRAA